MRRNQVLIIAVLFILFIPVRSQQTPYSFGILNFTNTAKTAGLGGYSIASLESDPSTCILTPSNINSDNHGVLLLNYVNYFADTDYGLINYTHRFKNIGLISTSLVYCNYGEFDYTDPSGLSNGNSFSANDLMLQIGHSRKIAEQLQIGVNLKIAGSFYEQYSALAIGSDVSLTYVNEEKLFASSLLVQNIGTSINEFQNNSLRTKLPFNIQFSMNKKLAHAPLKVHFIYHDLNRWRISQNTNQNNIDRNAFTQFSFDFFNHVAVGGEFLFSENFNVRLGYDFLTRRDLQPISRPGTIGISWGVGFKLKKISINYSNAKYHFSGASNTITITKKIGKISN